MRCFVALDPAPAVRNALSELLSALRFEHGRDWRVVAPQALHVTLAFLGEITPEQAIRVQQALGEAAAAWHAVGSGPVQWDAVGVGTFPANRNAARVLWSGVHAPGNLLQSLRGAVRDACAFLLAAAASSGDPAAGRGAREAAFRPHLTLARCRAREGAPVPWLSRYEQTRFGRTESDRFTLYQSTLTPQGAVYEPLAHWALR